MVSADIQVDAEPFQPCPQRVRIVQHLTRPVATFRHRVQRQVAEQHAERRRTRRLTRQLRQEMLTVYPQLAPLRTELAWSGLMSYARHLMPQIGRLGPGAFHCTAFGGHGLNTTAIGGTVVAEAVLGSSDRIASFAPWGLDWTGGPAGLAAAQLTYWSLQARDLWRERAA